VQVVSFSARLPNPEPTEAMSDLVARMNARRATRYRETMGSDHEEGLQAVEYDPDFRKAIEKVKHGFASLTGRARECGSVSTYSQNDRVARERVENLPPSWDDVRELMIALLKSKLRRFLLDDTTV
jgi:hypothetical protein